MPSRVPHTPRPAHAPGVAPWAAAAAADLLVAEILYSFIFLSLGGSAQALSSSPPQPRRCAARRLRPCGPGDPSRLPVSRSASRGPTFYCPFPSEGTGKATSAGAHPGAAGLRPCWPVGPCRPLAAYSRARGALWGPGPCRLLGSPLVDLALAAGSCGGCRGGLCARVAAVAPAVPWARAGGSGCCGPCGRTV